MGKGAPVTDWRALQTDIVNEEANLKEQGSLFDLDYEQKKIALIWRVCKAARRHYTWPDQQMLKMGKWIQILGQHNEGAIDEESEQMEAAVGEEEEVASCTKKRRKYWQKQLEFLE